MPNIAEGLLERLAAQYGFEVSAEQLLAYCYALLGTRGFQARFADELRTPGPRVPLTADARLFMRAVALGERLVRLHTYGQRCVPDADQPGDVPLGQARNEVAAGTSYPRDYHYDAANQTLRLGEGAFGPVAPAVWMFSVSGLRVVPAWLDRRVARPLHKRRSSPLDAIEPRAWTATLSQELLELVWVLEATLAMEPELDDVLDEVVRTVNLRPRLPGEGGRRRRGTAGQPPAAVVERTQIPGPDRSRAP